MSKWVRDVVLVPILIALVMGFAFMIWGAWYSGVKWHSPFSTEWMHATLNAPTPLWITTVALALAAGWGWATFVSRRALNRKSEECGQLRSREANFRVEVEASRGFKEEAERLAAQVKELEATGAKLHGIWNNSQSFWALGRKGEEPAMQIGGWIDLTSANTDEMIYLLAAYINEQRSDIFVPVDVKPNVVNHEMLMLFMVPPLETDTTKPFTATVVVEDQRNRKYAMPTHTFRAAPAAAHMPPGPTVGPRLHVAWRESGWCWIVHEGERVLRIAGDATLVVDNVQDPVIFTGVRVEGAESVGAFDTFQLKNGEVAYRDIGVDFRGTAPVDMEPIKRKLIFIDLRGNEYPTPEVTFKPLLNPELFGGLRWQKQ